MIVYPIAFVLMLSLPVALTGERSNNFRNRRMPITRSSFAGSSANGFQSRKNHVPFIIRVPYSKIVPSNALFSHSVSWKTKPAPPASAPIAATAASAKSADEPSTTPQTQADVQVSQFHAQDTNGQVVFGFNAPDQMRIEQRNADGTVHGTYSYLDPYGQIVKRQYWDTGAGFHVTNDNYPFGDSSVNGNGENTLQNAVPVGAAVQYTPEVQAARDLHFQLYQQALASFLPSAISLRNDMRRNGSIPTESENSSVNRQDSAIASDTVIVTPSSSAVSDYVDSSSPSLPTSSPPSSIATPTRPRVRLDGDENVTDMNHGSINIVQPDTDNGSIVIQKPEYLRISWTTENKKYRVNPGTGNRRDDNWSEKSTTTTTKTTTTTPTTIKTWTAASADIFNVTNFIP